MDGIQLHPRQEIRDAAGQRDLCAACGHKAEDRNPLVVADDGFRVHLSHILTEADSGYYGVPFQAAA